VAWQGTAGVRACLRLWPDTSAGFVEQRQYRIMTQGIVGSEVFIAQGQLHQSLLDQRLQLILDLTSVPMIHELPGEAFQNMRLLIKKGLLPII